MSLKINILSTEFVRPSSPTKDALKRYPLSLLDQLIPSMFIPVILYYSADKASNFPSRLKESLSDTLNLFYPLAGRLNKDNNSINCNDMGVRYIEAKVDSLIMDVIECYEATMVDCLVPFHENDDSHGEELMAIQVNYFDCGGIAICAYIPHKIADACSFFSFITSWATLSRGDKIMANPSFISSSLFPPMENLKYPSPSPSPKVAFGKEVSLVTRRFIFNSSQIKTMQAKARIDNRDIGEPTRVEAVSAFIWKCATCDDQPSKQYVASHMVNLRTRMVPREPEHTFGNLIWSAYLISCEEDTTNLAILARKVREGIKMVDDEFIKKICGEEGYTMIMTLLQNMGELTKIKFLKFNSWCRFPVYEADFGTGKPVWASIASLNSDYLKNSVFFIDSKYEDGIEAWVTMTKEDVTLLEQALKDANLVE